MIRDVKALLFLVVGVVVITLLVIEQTIEPNFNAYAHYLHLTKVQNFYH